MPARAQTGSSRTKPSWMDSTDEQALYDAIGTTLATRLRVSSLIFQVSVTPPPIPS